MLHPDHQLQFFAPTGFFVFRSPTLPIDTLIGWSQGLTVPHASPDELAEALEADQRALRNRFRELLKQPWIREAIFLASPDLDETIAAWETGTLSPEKAARVDHALVRYLTRMAARPTPFGLFATWSLGRLGDVTRLPISALESCRRHTRLDMDYLCALIEALEREPTVRCQLIYRPNSSLFEVADCLRYIETKFRGEKGRSYHLVALRRTGYLEAILARAALGATLESLAEEIAPQEGPDRDEARNYVDQLAKHQVLVSNLTPVITGPEPIKEVIRILESGKESLGLARVMTSILDQLQAMDARGLGNPPATYRSFAESMKSLPVRLNLRQLFQVDVSRPSVGATLGGPVVEALNLSIQLLHRIMPTPPEDPLASFKKAFLLRFENQFMPLMEVLDEELGLGATIPGGRPKAPSPLLDGINFDDGHRKGPTITPRDAYLVRKVMDRAGKFEWELTEKDLQSLEVPNPVPLPDSFSVLGSLGASSEEALDQGDFQLYVRLLTGPSGARLLGRFCHGFLELEKEVRQHLTEEEALMPEAIFAEVVHLPEGRLGNILCRPVLRAFELPYLGASGTDLEHQIPISDLEVSVVSGRVVLRSIRFGKEIVPRLSSAHDYGKGLTLYRFLCCLQDQGVVAGGWSWSGLESAPFLPRVRVGRIVLSRARWRLSDDELKPILNVQGSERHIRFQALRTARSLPRFVLLIDGDNEFLVDLDNTLWLEALLQLVAKRPFIILSEWFPGVSDQIAFSPEGRHISELVIPVSRQSSERSISPIVSRPSLYSPGHRAFPPGSEWIYGKLYTGAGTADQVLLHGIDPLVRDLGDQVDGWFFLRYQDPDNHLRVRLHMAPGGSPGQIMERFHAHIAPLLNRKYLWKVQFDTYEREIERYGGLEGTLLAEEIFHLDSETILALLRSHPGDQGAELRWRFALWSMDRWLVDCGLNGPEKMIFALKAKESFAKEFKINGHLSVLLGHRYRALRKDIETIMTGEQDIDSALRCGYSLLEKNSSQRAPLIRRLRDLDNSGSLQTPLRELV